MEKHLDRHTFSVSPKNNGGEVVLIITDLYDNGDGGVFINQKIELCSYCNSATLNLVGSPLTSEVLRELANQLDSVMCKYKK